MARRWSAGSARLEGPTLRDCRYDMRTRRREYSPLACKQPRDTCTSRFVAVVLTLLAALASACSMVQPTPAPLGSERNPVKLAFGPSADAPKVLAASQELTRALERETGL